MNPFERLLADFPICILDGGLATELEKRGWELNDHLWSSKVLYENPQDIHGVHRDYLEEGADCIITASYQATIEGFVKSGYPASFGEEMLLSSVTVAKEARDSYWAAEENQKKRPKPLVAASVGPYGAYLADGSEYRGNYGIDEQGLIEFHKKRLEILISADPDILACETIPCLVEAKALMSLIIQHPKISCWVSFSAKDNYHISSGEQLQECARYLGNYDQVAAIGINCTDPKYIGSLIDEVTKGCDKPVIVYPNNGDVYEPQTKSWHQAATISFIDEISQWYERGARIIGGCCRTTPAHIRQLSHWRNTHFLL